MFPIWAFGSEDQKRQWLPGMAVGEIIGCFGLTEADSGSDPGRMRTHARKDGSDWVVTGSKMWITNGGIADVAIVWAKTEQGIRGFVIPTDTPGFSTNDIRHKLSLRASVTSELVLDDVRLPESAALPGVVGLKGPLSCLNEARYGILFGAVGAARSCYEAALDYSLDRKQFGRPIASFQMTQRKLVDMMVAVNRGMILAMHIGRMRDAGTAGVEDISFGKMDNVRMALRVAREARSILGANGITLEYPVIRHMNNLESVFTYEGTDEVHTLILGEAITGFAAFH
jgi:glutaryl-CoA dehydrogenase